MKLKTIECPKCGGEISFQGNLKHCFCLYCGAKLFLDDGSTSHTYRNVDEARIKEAEMSARVRLKELEIEENKRLAKEKVKRLKIILSLILGIIGIILMVIGFITGEASGDSESPNYILAMFGMLVFISSILVWGLDNN